MDLLMAGDNGNLVEGNFIGTDPTGTIAIGNGVGDSDVELQGAMDDTIGGTTAAARNIISGDDLSGSPSRTSTRPITSSKGTTSAPTRRVRMPSRIPSGSTLTARPATTPSAARPPRLGPGAGNLIAGNSNYWKSASVMSSWATRSESSRCRAEEVRPPMVMESRFSAEAASRSVEPPQSMRTSSRATPLPGFNWKPPAPMSSKATWSAPTSPANPRFPIPSASLSGAALRATRSAAPWPPTECRLGQHQRPGSRSATRRKPRRRQPDRHQHGREMRGSQRHGVVIDDNSRDNTIGGATSGAGKHHLRQPQ